MTRRVAFLGCLVACGPAKPQRIAPTSEAAVSRGTPAASGDELCAGRLENLSSELLDPVWNRWLEWGATTIQLPAVSGSDPTVVESADIREHAVLARHGSMRFDADGPVIADAGGTAFMSPVFVLATIPELARVRIVSELAGVNLFVWVDQADLLPVPVARVQVRPPSPTGGNPSAGIWLTPGRILDVVDFGAAEIRGSTTFGGLRVEATVPLRALGYIFDYDHIRPASSEDVQLLAGDILAAPGGTPLATKDPALDAEYVEGHVSVLESNGAWRFDEIIAADGGVAVRGHVEATRLSAASEAKRFLASPFSPGSFSETTSTQPSAGERRLDRGTRLRSDDGAVVGSIRWSGYDLPDCGDGRVAVPTQWGALVLRADEESVQSVPR